jgi:hypothetical protein
MPDLVGVVSPDTEAELTAIVGWMLPGCFEETLLSVRANEAMLMPRRVAVPGGAAAAVTCFPSMEFRGQGASSSVKR